MAAAELLLGFVLLLVGFVFFGNGMTLLGKTGAKEIGVLNLAVAVMISIAAWKLHTIGLTAATALVVAFALIYYMVAGIFILGYDAKGLGWYCLFAFIVFVWYAYHFFSLAALVPAIAGVKWFGIFCLAWALLVILAFVALSLGKPIATTVAWLFLIESILTCLIPGMLLLTGKWHPLGGT
jgi:putative amide transporter protein